MTTSAEHVKELRSKTGAGILACREALQETKGDIEKAIAYLRERGIAGAARKVGRATTEGLVESYIHGEGRLGVLVEINCETDFVARTDEYRAFARDIAMHIAAAAPQYLNEEEIPAELLEREREILEKQALREGKPEAVVKKMVEGRLRKLCQEMCLIHQPFVKDPNKTVDDLRKEYVARLGENITIRRFVRFVRGEETS